ncbi:hypothetical protein H0H93_002155 [Arthromyces matolae]|nr:hypothetical protein H0H93_002155 [Arthromyces matolae]
MNTEAELSVTDPNISFLIARLRPVFADKDKYRYLLRSRDQEAQKLLDSFQWVLMERLYDLHIGLHPIFQLLDLPDLDDEAKKQIVVATQRLSEDSNLYPACYELKGVKLEGYAVHGGQFTEIYRGDFQGQVVCIKAIRLFQRDQVEHTLKKFAKEVILWGQLQHSNILPMFGVFRLTSKTRISFVCPWMENGNITTYLTNKPNSLRQLLALDVASGLQYLHSINIVHGNLRGANILIDNDGRARLSDFGISSAFDTDILQWTSQSSGASQGGSVRWQAPELFQDTDRPVDNTQQSDAYALACVFYEIFTDNMPLIDIKDRAVTKSVQSGVRPKRPEPSSPSWTRGLNDVIWALMERCWNEKPNKRPSSGDVMRKLQEIAPRDSRPETHTGISPSEFRRKMNIARPDIEGLNVILDQVNKNAPQPAHNDGKKVAPPSQNRRKRCIVM